MIINKPLGVPFARAKRRTLAMRVAMLAAAFATLMSFVGTSVAGAEEDSADGTAPDVTAPAPGPDGQAPADDGTAGELPGGEIPVEDAPIDEAPADEAPKDEAPVEEAPVEEAPVEEAPAEAADQVLVEVRAGQYEAALRFTAGVESRGLVVVGDTPDYTRAITVPGSAIDHEVIVDGLECDREYHAGVIALLDGHRALRSDDVTIRTMPCSINPDEVAPVSVLAYSDYAIVTWGTADPAKGMAVFGIDESYGNAAVEPHYSTFHEVYLTDLACDTTYQFRTVSEDVSGVAIWGDNQTFTTYACDPMVDSVEIDLTANGAEMRITTDEPTQAAVIYGLTRAYGSESRSDELGTEHTFVMADLACEAMYNYRIIAFAEGADRPEWSPQQTFVTGPCDVTEPVAETPDQRPAEEPVAEEPVADEPAIDEPAIDEPVADEPVAEEPVADEPVADEPVAEEPAAEEPAADEPAALEIGEVYVSHITKDEVQVNWSTNIPARGSIVWGPTPALGSELVSGVVAADQVLSLTDLECDTEYHFAVLAGGGDSPLQWSHRQSVVTADCGSATISDIVVDAEGDELTISWSTDIETTGLVIFGADFTYGSATIASGDGFAHSATINGLDCGAPLHLRIAAETVDGLNSWTKDIATGTAPCDAPPAPVPPTEDGRLG